LIGALAGGTAGYVLHNFYLDVHFHATRVGAFHEMLIRAWAAGKEILLGAVMGSVSGALASLLLIRVKTR
jgi:hypothetical protein